MTARKRTTKTPARPTGRDEVIEAIIEATIVLCAKVGPEHVSLRRIAEQAQVNYGLVHRHFGTKSEVVKAAIAKAHERAFEQLVAPSDDLFNAIQRILLGGTHTLANVLAWGILQGETDEVLPEESLVLVGLCKLAAERSAGDHLEDSLETRALVGTLIAALLGWRLYEPYIARGLKLDELGQSGIYKLVLPLLKRLIEDANP
jgi:AcrR family transcriptional regulator